MNKALLLPVIVGLLGASNSANTMSAGQSVGSQAVDQSVLYHNATLLNPATEQLLPNGWLLVKNGRIAQMGQQQPDETHLPTATRKIDLQDQYVLPGLIDVHLHLTAGPHRVEVRDGSPVMTLKGQSELTRYHALSTLATGITTAFSPAGEPEAGAEYVRQQQAGNWPGPKLIYAGLAFDPTPILAGTVYPKDEASWRAEINRQKALGVQYIKLYAGLSQQEVALGVRLTKEVGLKTVAHLDSVSWQHAAELGVDKLTHALPTSGELLTGSAGNTYSAERKNPYDTRFVYRWFEYADYDSPPMQRLFSTLNRQQTRVDLTLVANELLYSGRNLENLYPEENMWVLHPDVRRSWRSFFAAFSHSWSAEDIADAQRQMPKVRQLLKRLYDAGVPLAIGTDMTTSGPFYLRELQHVQAAGLSNWQVLQLATVGGARHLELPDIGQLAVGFVADFIVMPANPLVDLDALRTVQTVVQQGVSWEVADLKRYLKRLSTVEH